MNKKEWQMLEFHNFIIYLNHYKQFSCIKPNIAAEE